MSAPDRCKKRIFRSGGPFTGSLCHFNAVVGLDGYCTRHYPPHEQKRVEALHAKWDGEEARKRKIREGQLAVRNEEIRIISDYPRLEARIADRCVQIVLDAMRHYEDEDCTLTMRIALNSIANSIRAEFSLAVPAGVSQ